LYEKEVVKMFMYVLVGVQVVIAGCMWAYAMKPAAILVTGMAAFCFLLAVEMAVRRGRSS
jgi:hypothetical protein